MNRKIFVSRMLLMDQMEGQDFELDDKTIDLYTDLKEVIKKHGLSYEQTNKAIVVIDDQYFAKTVSTSLGLS